MKIKPDVYLVLPAFSGHNVSLKIGQYTKSNLMNTI